MTMVSDSRRRTPTITVLEYAARLRAAYVAHRAVAIQAETGNPSAGFRLAEAWTRRDGHGRTVWDRVAAQAMAQGLCPDLLVSVAFARFALAGGQPPMPNQLMTQHVLTAYRNQFPRVTVEDARQDLQRETEVFRRFILALLDRKPPKPIQEIRRYALLDKQVSVSPLFRYCAAASEPGLEDIRELYETPASVQFSPSWRAYCEGWGDFIPRDFAAMRREF